MTTFDEVLPKLALIFREHQADIATLNPILVNRDLNGRVRLIVDERLESEDQPLAALSRITRSMEIVLAPHAYPAKQAVIFESHLAEMLHKETSFPLEGTHGVYVVDRLATEGNWASISAPSTTIPRVVFFSIKGGVGRSTAMTAAAWMLAESGKRVVVMDLDLESPGLSSSLLPADRRPTYGIVDWLIEDLVDNGQAVFDSLVATSGLSHNGEILIVPAHGAAPGEYIAKLGRVWMPKTSPSGVREPWSKRLRRLIQQLEDRWLPDIILIDSRSGIDEVSSACLTDLLASTILLFAVDGDQTWSGYEVLFQHWRKSNVVHAIRERLQIVGSMIPEIGAENYFEDLKERSWDAFSRDLYDEVPAGVVATGEGIWSFDESDESAPHFPWPIRWTRGFASLRSLHSRFESVSRDEVQSIFGHLIDGIDPSLGRQKGDKI